MLGGGDLNSMLGVIVVLGVNAAYFQSLHETTKFNFWSKWGRSNTTYNERNKTTFWGRTTHTFPWILCKKKCSLIWWCPVKIPIKLSAVRKMKAVVQFVKIKYTIYYTPSTSLKAHNMVSSWNTAVPTWTDIQISELVLSCRMFKWGIILFPMLLLNFCLSNFGKTAWFGIIGKKLFQPRLWEVHIVSTNMVFFGIFQSIWIRIVLVSS